MSKTIKTTLYVALTIVASFTIIVLLLIKLFSKGFDSGPDPKVPEIQSGEFPFKLVYELNGEEITIEDTLICEYDGIGGPAFIFNIGTGSRRWKSYLSSDKEKKENCPLLLVLEDGTRIYYSTDHAAYYMGDGNKGTYVNAPFNGVHAVGPSSSKLHMMGTEAMLKYLNIVLIEWKIAPPIVNKFN